MIWSFQCAYRAPYPHITSSARASTTCPPSDQLQGIMNPFHDRNYCNSSIAYSCYFPNPSSFFKNGPHPGHICTLTHNRIIDLIEGRLIHSWKFFIGWGVTDKGQRKLIWAKGRCKRIHNRAEKGNPSDGCRHCKNQCAIAFLARKKILPAITRDRSYFEIKNGLHVTFLGEPHTGTIYKNKPFLVKSVYRLFICRLACREQR